MIEKTINQTYTHYVCSEYQKGFPKNLSLLELFAMLEEMLDIKMLYKQLPWRESDQRVFVADNSKIAELTGWKPNVCYISGIEGVVQGK